MRPKLLLSMFAALVLTSCAQDPEPLTDETSSELKEESPIDSLAKPCVENPNMSCTTNAGCSLTCQALGFPEGGTCNPGTACCTCAL